MNQSVAQFSIDEWISDGPHSNVEERATLCAPRMVLDNRNIFSFLDTASGKFIDSPVFPAVHLAEGIASNWWSIFGGRDRNHSLLPWRNGHALPDMRFEYNGAVFSIECRPLEWSNPKLVFMNRGLARLTRVEAEDLLGGFVEAVVDKLTSEDIRETEVHLNWARVKTSMSDEDERSFCEASGALGVDPYSVSERTLDFIESAESLFKGESLVEFLAAVRSSNGFSSNSHWDLVNWIGGLRPTSGSLLPDLHAVAKQIGGAVRAEASRPPWHRGYLAAKAFRDAVGLNESDAVSVRAVADKLGGARYGRKRGPRGVYAVVDCRGGDAHIHLLERGAKNWQRTAETFAFARAIGQAVCFPDAALSTVNSLHRAERQAVGRAFAAEFVAPENVVLQMRHDGCEIEEIAGSLCVNPMVVDHQMENSSRRANLAAWREVN